MRERNLLHQIPGGELIPSLCSGLFYLYEHCEEDDHGCCCNEEFFPVEVRQQENQREANCPSEPPVGDDELVLTGDGVHVESVHKESQHKNP